MIIPGQRVLWHPPAGMREEGYEDNHEVDWHAEPPDEINKAAPGDQGGSGQQQEEVGGNGGDQRNRHRQDVHHHSRITALGHRIDDGFAAALVGHDLPDGLTGDKVLTPRCGFGGK